MDDFNKPIRPIGKEEIDKIKIDPLYTKQDDPTKQEQYLSAKKEPNKLLINYIRMIKKLFNFILPEEAGASGALAVDPLWQDLRRFEQLLIKIRNDNPTQDLKFAEQISAAWTQLLEHFCVRDLKTSVNIYDVELLIDSIEHYPPESDHSFGYYLSKLAHKDWYPTPFFEMLRKLHEEYFKEGKSSELDRWISLIGSILCNIQKN